MRRFVRGACLAVALAVLPLPALAAVNVSVDLGSQQMRVYVNGDLKHVWSISSGRGKYATPTGSYSAKWLSRNHWSRKWNAAMPYAVFYYGGFAIHATYDTKRLGRPASHGCIRLAPGNAARFFSLVSRYGTGNTRINISY